MAKKRILITGHEGYIGSVMAPALARAGYEVVGVDAGYFSRCTLVPDPVSLPSIRKDIRALGESDLRGFDAAIHLAALSNDPVGNLDAGWTRQINYEASVRLAERAKAAGVRRFLFSSSCIMYGMSEAAEVNEDAPLDPRTEYARSKVLAERAIAALADRDFSPTFLRNGTIYGLSPRMRFDTVLNDLIGAAVTTGKVIVHSDGKPWRPVIHVRDVARAFMTVLEAPAEKVHNQAFNTGANHLNYQIIELAEIAARAVPGCRLEVKAQSGADQRTYKADFGKFARAFPEFEFQWNAESGARELSRALRSIGLTYGDFTDKRFTRLLWLRYLLDTGQLDGELSWRAGAEQQKMARAGERP
ncbi:MAG TPA: SDR family oxidoreductase [Candidatus Acidoferrales bacterium]|nr:SDR family oxidoreductase [Candidatus Acidoferrales bacterium]